MDHDITIAQQVWLAIFNHTMPSNPARAKANFPDH